MELQQAAYAPIEVIHTAYGCLKKKKKKKKEEGGVGGCARNRIPLQGGPEQKQRQNEGRHFHLGVDQTEPCAEQKTQT